MRYQLKIKDPSIVSDLYQDCIIHKEGEKKRFGRDVQGRLDSLQKVPCSLLLTNNSGRKQRAIVKYASLARNDNTGSTWLRTSEPGNTKAQYFFLGFYDDLMKLNKDDFLHRFNRLLFLALQPGQRTAKRVGNLLQRLAENELQFKTEQATIDPITWARFIKKYPVASQEVFDQCGELTISDQDVFCFLDALARTARNPKQIRATLNWLDALISSSNQNYNDQAEETIKELNREVMAKMLAG